MPLPVRRPERLTAYDLTGRTAFVTGAASGIGRATALLLAEAGAVVHCADRDTVGLAETALQVAKAGGTAVTHTLDVTSRTRLRTAMESADRLDILVTAAGIMHSSTVLETTDDDLDRLLAVNFKGVLYACQEAARLMLPTANSTGTPAAPGTPVGPDATATPDAPAGPSTTAVPATRPTPASIVTLASGAVDASQAGLFCYSATKAAVVQLTKTLATELGPHGIRVNSVAPGWIRTPMTARHDAMQQHRAEATMSRITPLGRVGEAEEVAHAILYLASDAAAFTTGQILRPNGGVSMPW
ncbi:SDR family NAD(P)-dependent oxidoreductase [Streptomyces sp. NPDC058657]|uniref:SDR family NAD(P)-dependent oxidoreductase n=1 Tax=unclassified Streptomyces TaxID=2593676 RepID=UPI003654A0F5